MFADPQYVTIDGVAHTLPRIGSGLTSGAFRKVDGTHKLTISHTENRRARRMVRLDHNKLASDPYVTGDNVPVSMGTYLVMDTPLLGYTTDEQFDIGVGFIEYLYANTAAALLKLVGGES